MFTYIAVNGAVVENNYGGGYGGEWISPIGGRGGSSNFDDGQNLNGGSWKAIDVPYWERRVKQIGKGKRHYFALNGWWHYIEIDDALPPLVSWYIGRVSDD